jgi:uncharacterized protein (TIGR02145 family)
MNFKTKQQFHNLPLIILGIAILSLYGCKLESYELAAFPSVTTTTTISAIKANSAISGGDVTQDAGTTITARGVCWSVKTDPSVEDSLTKDGSGLGIFQSIIKNLLPNTRYYVRAYAASSVGTTYYGKTISFKTADLSTVSTRLVVDSITATTAEVGGSIVKNNSDTILSKGVCWSTSINPTINDSLTVAGAGPGDFNCTLKNLFPNTTYFVRAYATDNVGTVYGVAVGFLTRRLSNLAATTTVTNISYTSATSGGNVLSDAGDVVTERGVCWSTVTNPTIADYRSSDGAGLGSYTSNLVNLMSNTQYYVRAYATSAAGTAYGDEVTFTTAELPTVDDIDGNTYHIITIGSQKWLLENLKTTRLNDGTAIPIVSDQAAWTSLSTPAYCYYNNISDYGNNRYGALYNWYAVSSGKLAPEGWRVATDADWTLLATFLNNDAGKLKEVGTYNWVAPNTGATNETSFSALPGGARGNNDGTYSGIGNNGYWWTSNAFDDNNVYYRSMSASDSDFKRSTSSKISGFSVRCVK